MHFGMTHRGTCLALIALTLTRPQPARACSVDAGVWSAAMEVDSASAQVPENGALLVRVVCALGPYCSRDPLEAVGDVRAPDGTKLLGTWSVHDGPVVAFVPSAPLAIKGGYELQLKGDRPRVHKFEVVAAFPAFAASALSASLALGEVTYEGVAASRKCCDTGSSCGPDCYLTQQQETAKPLLHVARVDGSQVPLDQLVWKAVSVDTGREVSCVGCKQLPVLEDTVARSRYCVEVSAHTLTSSTLFALGMVCTSAGHVALRQRETPSSEVPAVCLAEAPTANDAGIVSLDGSADASVAADQDPSEEAGVRSDAGASADDSVAEQSETGEGADESADEGAKDSSADGCSTQRHAPAGWAWLALGLLWRVRRRARSC
jgi:MYXO-CTERM domain-containing protein